MCLILISVFVLICSVLSINENDNNNLRVVQARYSFNHPPLAENYNPIPNARAYKDDTITKKAIKPKVEQKNESKIEEVKKSTDLKEETVTVQRIEISTTDKQNVTDSELDDKLVKLKARDLVELKIPVTVVYDSVPENMQNTQQAKALNLKNSRRYKQLRRRKQVNKTIIKNDEPVILNTGPTKLLTQTEIKNVESGKPEPNQSTFIIPQSKSVIQKPAPIEPNTSKHNKRERDPIVPIVNSGTYVFAHNGNFHYSYEGGDGTKVHSEGQLIRNSKDEAAGEAVSGGFSYTDKEGNDFSLSYTADENGYRPIGAHLPTPPPIPPAIARALAYLATATTPEPVTKPSVKHTKPLD